MKFFAKCFRLAYQIEKGSKISRKTFEKFFSERRKTRMKSALRFQFESNDTIILKVFRRKQMKIKVLMILSLAAFLFMVGCKGSANTSTTNGNMMNSNLQANSMMNTSTSTMTDNSAKNAVEAALKSKGFNDVTVEATTTEVTIRGTIPKGKMAEVNQVAQETGRRKVNNQVIEK